MMDRKSGVRLALLCTPLLGALAYIALNWYTIEAVPTRVAAGPEARKNPFLAYSRLLERMGRPALSASSPAALESLPEQGTLVIGARRLAYMTPDRVRRLIAWVHRGGTMVVEAEAIRIDDPLLKAIGVERVFTDLPGDARSRTQPPRGRAESPQVNFAVFDWPGVSKALRVRFFSSWASLRDLRVRSDVTAIQQRERTIALSFSEGEGRVTVLPSFSFLRNGAIGELDHAEFGWRLAAAREEARPIVLFLKMDSPPFLDWLMREAWTVVLAASLLVALWLARIVPRFGPLAPDAPPVRRSLLEHIVASGRFLWSRGQRAYLLEALRERAWRMAGRRGVATQTMAPAKALAAIARLAGTSEAAARRALIADAATAPAFVETAAALHEIESRLASRTDGDSPSKELKP